MKTKTDTLEYYLLDYLKIKGGWSKKVDLYVIADFYDYSPESCGRILRILTEQGKIVCEYYKGLKRGTKLAKYYYGEKPKVIKPQVVIINGVPTAIL